MSNFSVPPTPVPAPLPAPPPVAPPVAPGAAAPAPAPSVAAPRPWDASTADGLQHLQAHHGGAGGQGVPAAPAGAAEALLGFAPAGPVAPDEATQAVLVDLEQAIGAGLPAEQALEALTAFDVLKDPATPPEATLKAYGTLTATLTEVAGASPAIAAKVGGILGKVGGVAKALGLPADAMGLAANARAVVTGRDAAGKKLTEDERAQLATGLPFQAQELGAGALEIGEALAPFARKVPQLASVLDKAAKLAAGLSPRMAGTVAGRIASAAEFGNVPLALASLYVEVGKQSIKELAAGIRELDDALLKRKYGDSPNGLMDRYAKDLDLALTAVGSINNQKRDTAEYAARMDQIRGLNERVAKELANAPEGHAPMIRELRERLHYESFKIYDGPGEKMVNGLEVLDRYVKSYYGHDAKKPLTDQEHQWLAQHLSGYRMDAAAKIRQLEGLPPRTPGGR